LNQSKGQTSIPLSSAKTSLEKRESRLAFGLLAPTALVVLCIIIFPLVWNIWLSLKPVELAQLRGESLFTWNLGWGNYLKFLGDPELPAILAATLSYATLGSGLSIVLGLIAALCLQSPFRGRGMLRGLLISPYIAPVVAVAFTWGFILDPQLGIVNWLGVEYGLWDKPLAFFSTRWLKLDLLGIEFSVPLALFSVILFEAWRYFPFAFLFILARLQAIPPELNHAAQVDGAGIWQVFKHITLPQLYPVLASLFLFRFIWTINKFDDIFLLTRGQSGTMVLAIKVYDYAFGQFNLGLSSALAIGMFLFLTFLLALYFRWIIKKAHALV
jgi:multiple sugar transport system permease protein